MKKLYKMLLGRSWITANDVRFTREHPFQLVEDEDAAALSNEPKFREAIPDEVRDFYKLEEISDISKK